MLKKKKQWICIVTQYFFSQILKTLSEDNFLCFKVFDNIFVYVDNLCTHLVSLTLSTTKPSFSERNMVSFKDVKWITQLAAADVMGAFVRQHVEARVDTTLETCLCTCVICFQVEVGLPPTTVFFMFSFNSDQGETALWKMVWEVRFVQFYLGQTIPRNPHNGYQQMIGKSSSMVTINWTQYLPQDRNYFSTWTHCTCKHWISTVCLVSPRPPSPCD